MQQIRKRIFEIIEKSSKKNDKLSKAFDILIISLIVINIASLVANSFSELPESIRHILSYIEIGSVIIFTIEYLLRLITSDFLYPKSKVPVLKYVFSFMAIIDLLAIIPFYLPFIFPFDLRFLRIFRLFRITRVFKLNRYNNSMSLIIRILKNEKDKLISTFTITGILIIFASCLMYYVENPAQPDKFPNIIASIWWAVATLTTVGYGDVYPITVLGKFLSGVIAILGIGLVALPSGIISSGFVTEMSKKSQKHICPHCGKEIDIDN